MANLSPHLSPHTRLQTKLRKEDTGYKGTVTVTVPGLVSATGELRRWETLEKRIQLPACQLACQGSGFGRGKRSPLRSMISEEVLAYWRDEAVVGEPPLHGAARSKEGGASFWEEALSGGAPAAWG